MVNQFAGSRRPSRRSSPAATAWSSAMASGRRWRWRWWTGRCAPRSWARRRTRPAQEPGIRALPLRQRRGDRLRRAPEAAALRRFPERAGEACATHARRTALKARPPNDADDARGYNFAYLDESDQADDPPRHPEGGGDPRPPGAVRLARDAAALWLGHRRHPGDGRDPRPGRRAEGDRPGRRRHHQRRLHPPLLRAASPASPRPSARREATVIQTRHRIPETPLREGQILVYQVPMPEPLFRLEAARRGDAADARAGRLRPDAREAVRGHRAARPCRDQLQLPGAW